VQKISRNYAKVKSRTAQPKSEDSATADGISGGQ